MTETDNPQAERPVAYRSPGTRTLYCVICARQESGWQPVAAADVRGDTECDFCGGLVLAVAVQRLGAVVARYAAAAVPSAPADRAAIRDRIRRAVCEAEGFAWDSDMLEPDEYGDHADMVLAALAEAADRPASTAPLAAGLPLVQGRCPACGTAGLFLGSGGYVTCSSADCPEPDAATTVLERGAAEVADRAAILREAATIAESLRQFEPATSARWYAQVSENVGILRVAEELRRKADEAEYVATPCSLPNVCEDGGDPCSTHERLMAHAEGDHELCGPDCGTSPSRMAVEAQQPEALRCDVKFEGGGTCSKAPGHRTLANQDPHTPGGVAQQPTP